MNTKAVVGNSQEYRSIPLAELVESTTNPRKTFDKRQLEELAESIRSKGVLLPLLVRPVNGHYEIVAGERRYRASKLAGRDTVPATIRDLTDAECLEIQLVENLLRTDLHPFEEAQGFRALLDQEDGKYTIETIASKTGKNASFIAKRLKLLNLVQPVADVFLAARISVEHALLLAKLGHDVQEKALEHCFDGYYGADDKERSLVPVSRLQTWIEQNVYLRLQSVPFSRDDETLVADAGSCANCSKRTGFNRLLFSEVREDSDSCTDAACFNRKLDAHVARRIAKMPNLVQISQSYRTLDEACVRPRSAYVEVVARTKGKDTLPEHKPCNHLTTAIHTDGVRKGRLVKVCANPDCKIHFGNRKKEEEQRIQWRAEKTAANQKAKQTLAFRHRLLADVLKRVKPQFGTEELRMVAQFVLRSLSHELACRLAKRHGLQNPKDTHDWQMVEKARTLYKKADAAGLAMLIFEAMLIGSAGSAPVNKDEDLLADVATLYKVDTRALRTAVAKAEKEKPQKKNQAASAKGKAVPKVRTIPK